MQGLFGKIDHRFTTGFIQVDYRSYTVARREQLIAAQKLTDARNKLEETVKEIDALIGCGEIA